MGELDTPVFSQIGLLLAELAEQQAAWPGLTEIIEVLAPCQHRLFDLGGELAMPDYIRPCRKPKWERLEAAIDLWERGTRPLRNFILCRAVRARWPRAHVCRSLARAIAERRCQHLNAVEPLRLVGMAYVNRLSDLLFVAARPIARRTSRSTKCWQAARSRRVENDHKGLSTCMARLSAPTPARTREFPPRPERQPARHAGGPKGRRRRAGRTGILLVRSTGSLLPAQRRRLRMGPVAAPATLGDEIHAHARGQGQLLGVMAGRRQPTLAGNSRPWGA